MTAFLASGDAAYWEHLPIGWSAAYCAPFVLMLLSIAVLPLLAPHWWHKSRNQAIVAALFGLPIALVFVFKDPLKLGHTALEYAAFITLLASLFIISGGIFVRGALAGTPLVNTAFLLIGGVLANFVGTTGAAMLLIRPLLRANRRRRNKTHIFIFFIFIVANCGGCLTPLGDPPLYLGFLKGVPFEWTLRMWPMWATMVGALLVIFNLLDQYKFNKEDVETKGSLVEDVQPGAARISLDGKRNIPLLVGIVGSIVGSGLLVKKGIATETQSAFVQIAAMGTLAMLSMSITPKRIREENEFTFYPIKEVAILFAGIFAAMVPALLILNAKAGGFGLDRPWHFYLAAGSLSSLLDNAPTYLVFLEVARGSGFPSEAAGTSNVVLMAISLGSVFMGANTYIGNGPNFMVKSIVESADVKMPSFFGYMAWSAAVLWPLLAVVAFVFLR